MKTIVDWCGFRVKDTIENVQRALSEAIQCQNLGVDFLDLGRGFNGFSSSFAILVGGVQAGVVAFGGAFQRGWISVSLSGVGCGFVPDWVHLQRVCSLLPGFEFRRVDIALDITDGKTRYEDAFSAYLAGAFNGSGRRPKHKQILGEVQDGRTLYVGVRKGSDKFLRVYEKGLQLVGGRSNVTHIDGVPVEDWLRVEVEFKAQTNSIPPDIIDCRDQYFAGSYPWLQSLLAGVEPFAFRFSPRIAAQLDLEKALSNIRAQYGDTLHTALEAFDGDMYKLFARITSGEHNKKLSQSGVLNYQHL